MAEIKFCCCMFAGISRLVSLQAGDCKYKICEAFGIVLNENEEILVTDQVSGSIVSTMDLFELISSLQSPTDLKFNIHSRFQTKHTKKIHLKICYFYRGSTRSGCARTICATVKQMELFNGSKPKHEHQISSSYNFVSRNPRSRHLKFVFIQRRHVRKVFFI